MILKMLYVSYICLEHIVVLMLFTRMLLGIFQMLYLMRPRPFVAGISGDSHKGAYSVALSGGYDDDVDLGYAL